MYAAESGLHVHMTIHNDFKVHETLLLSPHKHILIMTIILLIPIFMKRI